MPEFSVRSALLIVLVILLGGGCATHSPSSEAVMFHAPRTQPSHEENVSFGVTMTGSPTLNIASDVAQRAFPEAENGSAALNPNNFSAGLYLAGFDSTGRYAISTTLGLAVTGLDATVQVWERNYLMASYSVPGSGRVFLQHRTYNSSLVGLALGLGYRRESFPLSAPCSGVLCFDHESRAVNSFGARSFAILREENAIGEGVKLSAYAGYIPELNAPLFSFSVSLGGF